MQSGFNYYNPNPILNRVDQKPLKAVILTSVRDVGASDMNGQMVQTREGERYMDGIIEAVLRDFREQIASSFEIAGVITDDTETDTTRGHMADFASSPDREGLWIFDNKLVNLAGERLTSHTHNVPSDFRSLPLGAIDERVIGKEDFEQEVLRVFDQMGGDILISDHLMLRAELLVRELRGRILNIHPAMTNASHPFPNRGPTPTAESLLRANGFMTNHETGDIESITPYNRTGATFHYINKIIDDGAVICDAELTQVLADYTPEELRYFNYQQAKIPVFLNGMLYYVNNLYPQITMIPEIERSTVLV